ncbi:MAG TPA: hypothetical protein VFL04_08740, partial [Rectinemataceae bacterium]|nr:hypothetical protein [Rectinemataceae bacterium]
MGVSALALSLALGGCFSLGGAVEAAMGRPGQANAGGASGQGMGASGGAQGGQTAEAKPAAAYQYQFSSFYSGVWSMGWFGYGESNYKPGQGTVWTFKGSSRNGEDLSFERALLRVNADKSQWWRFRLDTGKDRLLYEFLVGSDGTVLKVRYQDPD